MEEFLKAMKEMALREEDHKVLEHALQIGYPMAYVDLPLGFVEDLFSPRTLCILPVLPEDHEEWLKKMSGPPLLGKPERMPKLSKRHKEWMRERQGHVSATIMLLMTCRGGDPEGN